MIYIVPKPTDTPDDNSTGQVIHELEKAGAAYRILDLDDVDPLKSGLAHEVIWACGIRQNGHHFETLNVLSLENRVVNTPESIVTCACKVMTSALLIRHGVPTPTTLFTSSPDRAHAFIGEYGKAVYKPLYGFDGNGIRLVTDGGDLGEPPWYLQEYVWNDRDFRVFVIDGEAVGAIERVSDSLTHNIHQGGIGRPVEIDEEMRSVTEAAATAIGIDYCGVDLLRDGDGYTVLEVNGTPNWHCMAAPIPRLLAAFLMEKEREMRA
ncbi:ATP-grasp domain-containing protein [Methanoculleus sp. FWC-SCC1]|uniref:ATP-grasp domain-containing protein n=1 Tax=Methanoculleus frigidifontis TaxID=2584085 RepID=A0ABT8M6G1_9EURY|nr:ATP-grasp domain-containing protein [Methanoculleus sp. FWC-SCC1]MDN7023496.1 ATP-grasp domain-containing protein [Methanoculleus sp. FWC-SCC1]